MTKDYSPLFSASVAYTNNDLLSAAEASKLIHASPETLRRWTAQGRLPAKRTPGGHRRWERERLLTYAYEQQHPTPDDSLEIIVLKASDDNSPFSTTSEDLLSTTEASELLHVSPETLRRLTSQGRLPAKRTPGGHRRWAREAVLAYAYKRQHQADDDTFKIEVIRTVRAVWEGRLKVKRNGNHIWHEIEYRKIPFRWAGWRALRTIEKGGVSILEMPLQLVWRNVDGGCIARHDLDCTGATRDAVESEIKAQIPDLIEELSSLPTPDFNNPGGVPRVGGWPPEATGLAHYLSKTGEDLGSDGITIREVFPAARSTTSRRATVAACT